MAGVRFGSIQYHDIAFVKQSALTYLYCLTSHSPFYILGVQKDVEIHREISHNLYPLLKNKYVLSMSLSVKERLGSFIQQYKVKNVKDSFFEKNLRIFLQGINKKIDQCLQS